MSNTMANRKVTSIYDLHRLLAHLLTLFQTARTLYLFCVGAGYSKEVPILGTETRVVFLAKVILEYIYENSPTRVHFTRTISIGCMKFKDIISSLNMWRGKTKFNS